MRTASPLAVTLLLAACARAEPPAPPPVPTDPAEYYAQPAAAFFARAETQRDIPGDIPDLALLDAAVFHATNRVRAEHDLPPLTFDARLRDAAAGHVVAMIVGDFLAHENPHDESMRTPMQRVVATGYTPRNVSENLAQVFRVRYEAGRPYYKREEKRRTVFSYQPDGPPIPTHTYESLATELLREWMNSPGHRENVLRKDTRQLGAAVRFKPVDGDLDQAISVQVFALPR